ncbi:MAG: formylglycine-generating enzyme family protein [Planctomycetes bacterium]|nr:formylglycine-generating enzyme family protein [Planctomycetota bacterium]
MTAKRVCPVFLAIAGAAAVLAALPSGAPDPMSSARADGAIADTPADSCRRAMERAFLAAQKDHAAARAAGFDDRLADLVAPLRTAIAAARLDRQAPATDAIAKTLGAVPGTPLSDVSLRVVVAALLSADRATWPADTDVAVRDALLLAVHDLFSAAKFEDCWDARFRGLAEVVAWQKAHGDPATESSAPPRPGAGPTAPPLVPDTPVPSAPGPPNPPDATPPGPVVPAPGPSDPPDATLPLPDAADASANLVAVDRARGWVGPWTGWVQDLPAKDNHRQRRPAKTVWIDRYEVTCAAYLAFLKGLPAPKRRAMLPVAWSVDDAVNPAYPEGRGPWPVTGVTYFQAVAFAESLGKRLPTEDEWDRAAAGGDKEGRAFPWGSDAAGHRWAFAGSGADSPAPVDAAPSDRTADGVVGLAGNVAEMVATLPDRRDAPTKLQATQQIVVRGGSWKTSRESDCGTTFRWVVEAGQAAPHVGFRCVMDESEYKKHFGK